MREGHLIFTSLWGKRAVLLVSWALSVLALIIFAAHNDLNKLYRNTQSWEPELRLPTNQMGAVSYRRYNSKENGRPVHSISFSSLLVENNNFGIFKTAVHKLIKIRDLELTFHQYTPPDRSMYSAITTPDASTVPEGTFTYPAELLNDIYNLIKPRDRWRINIDISNTSEICVTNFDYNAFYDGAPLLIVRSKRATTSNKHPDVVTLRGHVIVKAEDGSVLESNSVMWDTRKHHFIADGTYFLSRNGKKIRGKDICVDDKLNIVQAQIAAFKERSKENG
jgi:hypothetical protein